MGIHCNQLGEIIPIYLDLSGKPENRHGPCEKLRKNDIPVAANYPAAIGNNDELGENHILVVNATIKRLISLAPIFTFGKQGTIH